MVYIDLFLTIVGILMVSYGAYQISPPLGWMVLGFILIAPKLPKKGGD